MIAMGLLLFSWVLSLGGLGLLLWGGTSEKGKKLPLKIKIPSAIILLILLLVSNLLAGVAGVFILLLLLCRGGKKEGFSPLFDTAKLLLGLLFWGGLNFLFGLFLSLHYNVRNHHTYRKCLKSLAGDWETFSAFPAFSHAPLLLSLLFIITLLLFLAFFLYRRSRKKLWNTIDGLLLFFFPLFIFLPLVTATCYFEQKKEELWAREELTKMILLCREKKKILPKEKIQKALEKSIQKYRFTYERSLQKNSYLLEIVKSLQEELKKEIKKKGEEPCPSPRKK